MSTRYGRGQFLKDAARLGIAPDAAFSHAELRRRRDHLMIIHHPDRGGDTRKAARINAIYARMLAWLDARRDTAAEMEGRREAKPVGAGGRRSALAKRLTMNAGRVWGLAAVAVGAYAALRRRPKV